MYMKKSFYTKLILALAMTLFATGATYAQDAVKDVKLRNGASKTWNEFVMAINNPGSIKGEAPDDIREAYEAAQAKRDNAFQAKQEAEAAYATAETAFKAKDEEVENLRNTKDNLQSEYNVLANEANLYPDKYAFSFVPSPVVSKQSQAASDFATDYKLAPKGREQNKVPIWVKVDVDEWEIWISFTERSGYEQMNTTEFYALMKNFPENHDELEYTDCWWYLFCGDLDQLPAAASLLLEPDGSFCTEITVGVNSIANTIKQTMATVAGNASMSEIVATPTPEYEALLAQVSAKYTQLNAAETALIEANTVRLQLMSTYNAALSAQTLAVNAYNNAEIELTAAKTVYDDAVEQAGPGAIEDYKFVYIMRDIETGSTLPQYDGTIVGNGHVIKLKGGNDALIYDLQGKVDNLAIVGGKVASNGESATSIKNCAYQTSTGTAASFIGEEQQFSSVGDDFINAIKSNFGFDLAANEIANKTDLTKNVYLATLHKKDINGVSTETFMVNIASGELVTKAGAYTVPTNRFVAVEDAVSETNPVTQENVIVKDGSKLVCANVVIKEGTDFYSPLEFQAQHLSYNRNYGKGWAAECLPFAVEQHQDADGNVIGMEGVASLYSFDSEEDGVFWFINKYKIGGNLPSIVYTETGGQLFSNLEDVTVLKSPVEDYKMVDPKGGFYGTYRKITGQEIADDHNAKLYGFSGGKFVKADPESAYFNPFRGYFISKQPMAAVREMRIRGIDDGQTTGIDKTTAAVFTATGDLGAIKFTADENIGTVNIYTVSGQMAASAEVNEGLTTVSLPKGIYVIKGQKVTVY